MRSARLVVLVALLLAAAAPARAQTTAPPTAAVAVAVVDSAELCREAGYDGPLNRCSIYGSEAAGDCLLAMMELGLSRPWPEALETLTGERTMDATALLDYYAPLMDGLEAQNEAHGYEPGW